MKSRIRAGSGSSLPDRSKDTVIGSPQSYTSWSTARHSGTFSTVGGSVGDGVGLRVAKGIVSLPYLLVPESVMEGYLESIQDP
jgi:hypothetical protein